MILCDRDVTTNVRPAIAQHGLEIRVAVIDRAFDQPCRSNLTYEESIAELREAGSKKTHYGLHGLTSTNAMACPSMLLGCVSHHLAVGPALKPSRLAAT